MALADSPKAAWLFIFVVIGVLVGGAGWATGVLMHNDALTLITLFLLCVMGPVVGKWYFEDFDVRATTVLAGVGGGAAAWGAGGWLLIPLSSVISFGDPGFAFGIALVMYSLPAIGIGMVLLAIGVLLHRRSV